MLALNELNGFGQNYVKTTPPPVVTRTGTAVYSGTTSGTSRPANVAVGTAYTGRVVVVAAMHVGALLPTSITIGGVTAPAIYVAGNVTFYAAVVPTGTTASIVCTLTASGTGSVAYLPFTVSGAANPTVPDLAVTATTANAASPFSLTSTISTVAEAWIFLCVPSAAGAGNTVTLSSLTPTGTIANGRSVASGVVVGDVQDPAMDFSATASVSSGQGVIRVITIGWNS
jgi:hypothetical protein